MNIESYKNVNNTKVIDTKGVFSVLEDDLHNRQLLIDNTGKVGVLLGSRVAQFMAGKIHTTEHKAENEIVLRCNGVVLFESTHDYINIVDCSAGLVVANHTLYAYEKTLTATKVKRKVKKVRPFSSGLTQNEFAFGVQFKGSGFAAVDCLVQPAELTKVTLAPGDILRVKGQYAAMWNTNLSFSVEVSADILENPAISIEDVVFVYTVKEADTTGSVWLATVL